MASIDRFIVSNVVRRPIRTFLSVLAIAVQVTMILTLVGVSYGTSMAPPAALAA